MLNLFKSVNIRLNDQKLCTNYFDEILMHGFPKILSFPFYMDSATLK